MNWSVKARIARGLATLPWSETWYRMIQKRFGRLDGCPDKRLNFVIDIIKWLRAHRRPANGSYVEVGTGHVPIVPIGLWLAGAQEIWTYDLNRRLDSQICIRAINWLRNHRDSVAESFMAAGIDIDARLREIDRIKDVKGLFQTTGIHYIAPGDASQTNLPEKSIDVHFSVTVLEHVEPNALNGILREARRMLKPNGVAIHMID